MKLKTIKQRIFDGTENGALKTIAILLGDKTWSKDHVKILCSAMVIAKKSLVSTARRCINGRPWFAPSGMGMETLRVTDIMLHEINSLPEWIKYDIIVHDAELGELFMEMSESLRNTWILLK